MSRRIEFEGPANFRDLGGYETRDGRRVRTGCVFRSDSLSYMTDSDVRRCVDELGLHTVVDLRAGHEVDEFSHGPLEATGVRFLHRPVIDETRRDRVVRDPGAPPPELMSPAGIYLLMLERFANRLTDVVRLVADPANHPVVFHFAAEAAAMRDVLEGLEARHGRGGRGGVEGYLLANGLEPDAVESARRTLLV